MIDPWVAMLQLPNYTSILNSFPPIHFHQWIVELFLAQPISLNCHVFILTCFHHRVFCTIKIWMCQYKWYPGWTPRAADPTVQVGTIISWVNVRSWLVVTMSMVRCWSLETINVLHVIDTPVIPLLASAFLSIENLEIFLLETISSIWIGYFSKSYPEVD